MANIFGAIGSGLKAVGKNYVSNVKRNFTPRSASTTPTTPIAPRKKKKPALTGYEDDGNSPINTSPTWDE